MTSRPQVTLQIALTPGDYECARHTVPHQLRQLGSQVGEILLTIDTNGANLLPRRPDSAAFERLIAWIDTLKPAYPHLRAAEADYRPETIRRVARLFFGAERMPTKTYRGAFYAYFEGLMQAANDRVLHLDSDLLIGGGSPTWVREAAAWLDAHLDVFTCSPLAGAPTDDLRLKDASGERLPAPRGAYRFQGLSTRVFFLDRRSIQDSAQKLRLRPSALRQRVRAWLEGFPTVALPEDLVTDYMLANRRTRVDFLGEPPGMWTLHPPYRNQEFFHRLPAIIQAVETGDVPAGQRGDYDLNDSMIDWSDAREAIRRNRWWKRYLPKFRWP